MKRFARFMADAAIVAVPALLRDAAGLAGAGAVAYGAWLVYPPAGFMVGGGLLIAGAWLSGKGA